MSPEAGLLERLALFAAEALAPLKDQLAIDNALEFVEELGLRLPSSLVAAGPVQSALSASTAAASELADDSAALFGAMEAASTDDLNSIKTLVEKAQKTIASIVALIDSLKALGRVIETAAAALPAEARATISEFLKSLPKRIVDRLVLDHLDRMKAGTAAKVALTGIVDDHLDPGVDGDPLRIPHQHREIHLDKLGKLLREPSAWFEQFYGLGAATFDGREIFRRIEALLSPDRVFVRGVEFDGTPYLSADGFTFTAAPHPSDPSAPKGLVVTVGRPAIRDWVETVALKAPWSLFVDARARFEAGLAAGLFLPSGKVVLKPAAGEAKAAIAFGLRAKRSDEKPMTLIGLAGATRLEARAVEVRAGIEFASVLHPAAVEASPRVALSLEGLNCVLDLAGSDGFLKSITKGGRGRTDVSLNAIWTPSAGIKFTGSAALELAIPAHARIGPATIETIYLVGGLADEAITFEISAALRGELGPFKAVVERIGVLFTATFPEGGGSIGPLDLKAGFQPPTGLGLSISGGGFSGGGFLDRDPANGEYGGALEVTFQDVIQVKAFGVLNTKMPDGSEGFSLAVVISAEFTPIQLSFGFTLMGVGGLLGVNRTALVDQLRLGLRDGSMDSILFPKNLVANAPRIIGDLKRMFPPQEGRFLIGPMAKLGWGTPALVTLDIGLILEIPKPGFAILGILRLAMPAKDAAILDLQVNFLGIVDFERKELSFDASLFDSRLLAFTLTGDMALRIYWGDNANFLMTVGGFHPDYNPPPLALPPLNRLAISMWAGNPRLSAEAYFAITSNTVQFGAKVELYYGVKVFNVYGFISLDALIQFDPFQFVAKIAGQVAVRSGGSTLFSIRLDLLLEGPTPWHASGRGSFEIGFIVTVTISADFEVTFGDRRNTSLPPILPRLQLEDALRVDAAWRVLAPQRPQVAARELGEGAGLVVNPMGALVVSQKAVPLGLPLARVGARRVEGPNLFTIVDVSLGAASEAPETAPVEEQFAPAQFLDLKDAEKLSRRSFEPFNSGVEIGGGAAPRADAQTHVDVVYEVIYVRKPRRRLFFSLRDALMDMLLSGSAAARSKYSAEGGAPTRVGTAKVVLPKEEFVLAGIDDLAPVGDARFSSQSAAHAALAAAVANDARLSNRLQVVSAFEVAA